MPRPIAGRSRSRRNSGRRRPRRSSGRGAGTACSMTHGRRFTAGLPGRDSTPAGTRSTGMSPRDEAIEEARSKPKACVILQRPMCQSAMIAGRDHDWQELDAKAPPVDCVPLAATDPLYILYTSGTTGVPKGVVRDNGGHAVALHWSMRHVYGMAPGEAYWAASDIGWAVGHSYTVYAPLLYGCTSFLYG